MAWSDLPADLLRCISSHLPLVHFLRLSSVCTWWNSALAKDKDGFLGIRCPPSPWLLLPSASGEASDTLTFRDLTILQEEEEEEGSRNGCSHRRFSSLGSHISGRRCIGSKDGWLVTLDKTDLEPRLFNPLTKAEISLPSLFTIPEDGEHRIKPQYASDGSVDSYFNEIHPQFGTEKERFRDIYFQKIVLSSNDRYGTAIVIYGYLNKLVALARPGDQTWVLPQLSPYIQIPGRWEEIEDVYYHEEERRFYAITHFSAVIAFDINGQNTILICPGIQDPLAIDSDTKNYIAFLSGTLIKIERVIECIDMEPDETSCTGKTTKISVFKFVPAIADSSCSSSQWISIKDLDGCSLFVGCNQTFSLHHTVAPGIKPNCIYFSDNWEIMTPKEVDRDAGFFDLHNDCFQYYLDFDSQPNWPPSIWFTPSVS